MKFLLTQIAQLFLALLAVYGVLLGISLLLVPDVGTGGRLDTARASSSLFLTEPKFVFLSRGRLNTNTDKVILLGASNVLAGFKQPQVEALIPDQEVHNLAVGGSNISQISQIVDLVREVQTPEARRHNTYVIGIWYGLMASDKARWYSPDRNGGDTDIDIERYRYGFYRRTEAGAVAVLPPSELALGVTLVHPYLVLDRFTRDVTQSFRDAMSGKSTAITDAQRNAIVLSDQQKRHYLSFWRDYMGHTDSLGEAPYQTIDRIVDKAVADGSRVVLVDMPIPKWHAQGSLIAADYRRRTDAEFARLRGRPGVSVLDMHDIASDDDFRDEVHPKPRVAPAWAHRLAGFLRDQTKQLATASAAAQ